MNSEKRAGGSYHAVASGLGSGIFAIAFAFFCRVAVRIFETASAAHIEFPDSPLTLTFLVVGYLSTGFVVGRLTRHGVACSLAAVFPIVVFYTAPIIVFGGNLGFALYWMLFYAAPAFGAHWIASRLGLRIAQRSR